MKAYSVIVVPPHHRFPHCHHSTGRDEVWNSSHIGTPDPRPSTSLARHIQPGLEHWLVCIGPNCTIATATYASTKSWAVVRMHWFLYARFEGENSDQILRIRVHQNRDGGNFPWKWGKSRNKASAFRGSIDNYSKLLQKATLTGRWDGDFCIYNITRLSRRIGLWSYLSLSREQQSSRVTGGTHFFFLAFEHTKGAPLRKPTLFFFFHCNLNWCDSLMKQLISLR